MLPLVFFSANKPVSQRWTLTQQLSSITHAHPRSVLACFFYLEYARYLLQGLNPQQAYQAIKKDWHSLTADLKISSTELITLDRLLHHDVSQLPEDHIQSDGYVIHTLEASLWC
ncbi:ADP-ribosylglycohydrolase family protein, partial [Arthrospira platensis SPKY1]|nr:ADP-ribosylglycohydrolase family protein [Arthrospira platensis SPKY1]